MSLAKQIQSLAQELNKRLATLAFPEQVAYIYNAFDYAFPGYIAYTDKFATNTKRVFFLGMNPGPWGMSQTGVPFGEIPSVKDWMGLYAEIGKPDPEHPKRPVDGYDCQKSEVSGRRLWGYFAEKFGPAENFFKEHFVANYCPLAFMEESSRNLTPDKLPAEYSKPLEDICDWHLQELVNLLQPEWVVGVGGFAEKRAKEALADMDLKFGRILHPSPASPAANRDWAGTAEKQLFQQGIWES